MLRHVYDVSNMDTQIDPNSLPRLKTWKFNICYPAKTLVCLSWILFGRPFGPFDRNWLTMQPLFCYIFKRSSACDWLFLLTILHSLSPPWKRAKCSPRQSKNSKIFPGTLQVGIFTACTNAPPPPHEKSWLRVWCTCFPIKLKSDNFSKLPD